MSSHSTSQAVDPDSAINNGDDEKGHQSAPGHVLERASQARPLIPIRSLRVPEHCPPVQRSTPSTYYSIASPHPLAVFTRPATITRSIAPTPDSLSARRCSTQIPNRPIVTKEPGPARPGLFISLNPKFMPGIDILTFNAVYGRRPEDHTPLLTESKAHPAEEYLPTEASRSAGTPNARAMATPNAMHTRRPPNASAPGKPKTDKNPTLPLASSLQRQKKRPSADDSAHTGAKQAPKPNAHKTKVTKRQIIPADEAARYDAGASHRARVYANLFSNANRFLDANKATDGAETPADQLPQQRLPFRGLMGKPLERSNAKDSNAEAGNMDGTLKKLNKLMNTNPPKGYVPDSALEAPHMVNSPHPPSTTLGSSNLVDNPRPLSTTLGSSPVVNSPHPPSTTPITPHIAHPPSPNSSPSISHPPIPSAHTPSTLHPTTARSLLTAWLTGGSYADMASPGCTEHGEPEHRPRECRRCGRQIRVLAEWKANGWVGGYTQKEGRRWVAKWMVEKWGVGCGVEGEGGRVFSREEER